MEKVKFSIRYKISIYVAVLLIVTVGLLYLYILFFGKNILLEQLELRYVSLGNSLANTCKPYILEENLKKLNFIAKESLKEKGITTIYISSIIDNHPLVKLYKKEEEKVAWVGRSVKNIYYSKNVTVGRGKDYSQISINISSKEKELARLRVIYSNQEVNQRIDRIAKDIICMFFVILGIGLIGVIILSNFIVNPITKMAKEVSFVGGGDLSREIKVKTNDEIKLLAENFNQMVVDLRKSKEELEGYSKVLEEKVNERTKELQEAHERIVQSEKMAALGQLASSVSHELRNPLGAVKLVTYYLKGKLIEENPALVKHIEDIDNSLGSAQRIVSNILSFSQPGKLIISDVNINEIIEEILKSKINRHLLEKVRTTKELEVGLPLVKADKDQIVQVIENLLLNAAQAVSERGEVAISSISDMKDGKEFVRVSIKDNGWGVSEENMEKLFRPFFTIKPKGIGLGLFISKNIMDKHGGEILVNSEIDKGSTFSILLPVDSGVS